MSQCIDKNDQTTNNALALKPTSYTNSRGEYTLAQIDKFAEDFEKFIKEDTENNPIIVATNRYGDSFYDSYNPLNGFLRNRDDLNLYPDLQTRINIGDITALEYADFIKQFNHSPDSAANKRNTTPNTFLFELDSYYKASFSKSVLGGFCSLMPQIFGAIEAFFDLLDEANAIINDAIRYLDKIRNYRQELSNLTKKKIVEKLIEEITEKILEFVDEIFLALEEAVFNFDVTQFEQDPPPPAGQRIVARATRLKEEVSSFFTEDTKERIKAKFRKMIDYAVGLWENPSLDEIQYLVARFCALATGIEALIKDVKAPLDNFESKYTTVVNRITNISNATSAEAIRNGAVRLSDEAKRESINTMEELWQGISVTSPDLSNTAPVVDSYTPTGEIRIFVPPATSTEYADIPTFESIKSGKDSRFEFSGNWVNELGPQSWNRVDINAKVALLRFQEKLGFKIKITNAWRSSAYNESLIRRGTGAVKNSPHLQGLAFDISRPEIVARGFTDIRVAQLAAESGFKIIIVYPPPGQFVDLPRQIPGIMIRSTSGKAAAGFYHLDIRRR